MLQFGCVRTHVALVLASSLLGFAGPAFAQVTTVPEPIRPAFLTSVKIEELVALTTLYNAGQWTALQKKGREIVAEIRKGSPCAATDPAKAPETPLCETNFALDTKKTFVALTWIGRDAFAKNLVLRVVVHDPLPEMFSPDLPGLHEGADALIELFLSKTDQGKIASAYASTREADPLAAALPAFLQAIAGGLFGGLSGVQGAETAGPKTTLFATVRRVGLPMARASVKLLVKAKDPWLDEKSFVDGLAPLGASAAFDDVPNSPSARKLIADDIATLKTAPAACNDDFVKCKDAFDTRLSTAFKAAVAACNNCNSGAELAALQLVDKRFRAYVSDALITTADLDLTFHNRPLTKIAFGAGTAYIPDAHLSKSRAKLNNNGVVVADPLPRVATLVFVNWSPAGYNSESTKISGAERLRVTFGSVLTPDFGFMIGGNFLLARGIGIGGGVALLIAKGASGEQIGSVPNDAKDPFDVSWVTAPFIGITYNYK